MRRFILITDGLLIDGIEFSESGTIVLDDMSVGGPYGEYNFPCTVYENKARLMSDYAICPLLWLDADHSVPTQAHQERAEEIRRHWIANKYEVEQREYESNT